MSEARRRPGPKPNPAAQALARGGFVVAAVALVTSAGWFPLLGLVTDPSAAGRWFAVGGATVALAVALAGLYGIVGARRWRRLPWLVGALGWVAYALAGSTAELARSSDDVALLRIAAYALLTALYLHGMRARFMDAALYTAGFATALGVGLFDEAVRWWLLGALADGGGLVAVVAGIGGGLVLSVTARLGSARLELTRSGWVITARAVALLVLAGLGLVHLVYLGHAIELPSAAAVARSSYRRARLAEIDAAWRPPAVAGSARPWLSRADHYADEAGWHRLQLEGYLAAGRLAPAFQEQVALSELYPGWLQRSGAPALSAPDLARLEVARGYAARLPRDLGPRYIVTAWDPLTLWLFGVALASGLLLGAELLRFGRGIDREP